MRRLRQNPQKAIDDARNGSRGALMDVANLWQAMGPQMLQLGVLDAFFANLDAAKAPGTTALQDNAFMSLIGLTKVGNFIGSGEGYSQYIIRHWPGVFKWCVVLYDVRVAGPNAHPQTRLTAANAIAAAIYGLSSNDDVKSAMANTPGCVELVTRLWWAEDPAGPAIADIPSATAALESVLRYSDAARLNRVLSVGQRPGAIAKRALQNFKHWALRTPPDAKAATISADLLNQMSRVAKHPLRHAILGNGTIGVFTQALVHLSDHIERPRADPILVHMFVSLLGYMWNCLESTDGFTWVKEAVNAGLPVAFARLSPHFSKIEDKEELDIILKLCNDLLPRYTVYRSVVEALVPQMKKAEEYRAQVMKSPAHAVWHKFATHVYERNLVCLHAKATKGKAQACDNIQCNKIDDKKSFKKCSGCGMTYYCSKECQVTAWKQGDHKSVCKLKQQDKIDGKLNPISKGDADFLHALATREAKHHAPELRAMAKAHPVQNRGTFIVCIDFTVWPEKYSVKPLADFDLDAADVRTGERLGNMGARAEAMVERAMQNPNKVLLINSMISAGQAQEAVQSMVACNFWGDGNEDWKIEYDEDDEDGIPLPRTAVDEVDMMHATMLIDSFARKFGDRFEPAKQFTKK
ncbi:hypothetical protein AURDEDRAFT_114606 [Auricularia subglabra TFB-10046 SS5]|nr:hypothetical protein AURDEDRAFT_114606 [Auricularia subglabra TFB-10046 SS5]